MRIEWRTSFVYCVTCGAEQPLARHWCSWYTKNVLRQPCQSRKTMFIRLPAHKWVFTRPGSHPTLLIRPHLMPKWLKVDFKSRLETKTTWPHLATKLPTFDFKSTSEISLPYKKLAKFIDSVKVGLFSEVHDFRTNWTAWPPPRDNTAQWGWETPDQLHTVAQPGMWIGGLPSLVPPSPPLPLPSPTPLNGGPGITPGNFFEIKGARGRVLEHFGPQN